MRTNEVKILERWPWIFYEGKRRQIKSYGIREPKKRVKNYRVEIRPRNSKTKIWVGTFGSPTKAMRAYDAAVYLIGKEPYYYVYPKDYLPTCPSGQRLKHIVQAEAKRYAEKSDVFPVNPLSLLSDTSRCGPRGLAIPEPAESHQSTSMDGQEIVPMDMSLTNMIVEEVDGKLVAPAQQEEFQALAYAGHHGSSNSWPLPEDLQVTDNLVDDETKVPAAYLRGLNAPNPSVVNDLLHYPPPESFNVFPYIQGGESESILDVLEMDSSSKLIPFKRERESLDALSDHFDGTNPMSWSTLELGNVAMPEDHSMEDWCNDRHFELESGYSNNIWLNTSP